MRSFRPAVVSVALSLLALASCAFAQHESAPYVRKNAFGVLFAYSNDSSHILFGQAEQRKLLNIGVSYSRKLIAGRIVNFQYEAEFLPIALESDPLIRAVVNQTEPTPVTTTRYGGAPIFCAPLVFPFTYVRDGVTYSGVTTITCHDRQWTMGTAMAPAGLQWNFLPRHRLQFFLVSHGGCMFSAQNIPVGEAGSFNFTVDAGGGIEYFRTASPSAPSGATTTPPTTTPPTSTPASTTDSSRSPTSSAADQSGPAMRYDSLESPQAYARPPKHLSGAQSPRGPHEAIL